MTDSYNNTLASPLPKGVTITDKANNYPVIDINNDHAEAQIAIYGGHVLQYQPKGQKPVLWVSDTSAFEQGRAVRGGIPLCWPWFGDHPDDKTLPAHGFARIDKFELMGIESTTAGETIVKLQLENNTFNQAFWNDAFLLDLQIMIGESLSVAMTMHNKGDTKRIFSSALHSYFSISDVDTMAIQGLDQTPFYDKIQGFKPAQQEGDIIIDQEVDRVYLPTSSDVLIVDKGFNRTIRIAKSGSASTVVWNPWIDKSAAMRDFHENGYRNMICVETTNALDDSVSIGSGESHTICTHISTETLL